VKKLIFFIAYVTLTPLFNSFCKIAEYKPHIVLLLLFISVKLVSYLYNLKIGNKMKSATSILWAFILITLLVVLQYMSAESSDLLVYANI